MPKYAVILNVTEYHDCIEAGSELEAFNNAQDERPNARSITMNNVTEIKEPPERD